MQMTYRLSSCHSEQSPIICSCGSLFFVFRPQRRKLDPVGRGGSALVNKRGMIFQVLAEQFPFHRDLLSQLMPHDAVPLPREGSG